MPRAFHIGGHIGAVVLDGLEAADRTTELGALFHIFHRHIHDGLGAADHLDAVGGSGAGQGALNDRPGPAHFAKHGFIGYCHPVQPHLAKALVADGADLFHRHAGGIGGDKEQADAILRVVAGRVVAGVAGAGGDDDDIGGVGIGDEQLGSGEGVAAGRGGGGDGFNAPGLGSGGGFGEGQGEADGAGADAGQQVLLLLIAAGIQDGEAAEDDGGEVGGRQQGAPHFLNEDGQVEEGAAGAAVLLGEGDAGPAQAGEVAPEVVGVALGVVFQFAHQREGRFLGEELPRRVFQHLLDFAQSHIHKRAISGPGGNGWWFRRQRKNAIRHGV